VWHIITEEDQQRMAEASRRQFEQAVASAERKRKALEAWEKSHPPCPHCGHQPAPPFWLTYG
jgi:hypothetical protein